MTALARGQTAQDLPKGLNVTPLAPESVRLIAAIPPATWYVGQSSDGTQTCALGVYGVGDGSVSTSQCTPDETFLAQGLQTFIGTANDQSHVWLVPDSSKPPVGAAAWRAIGPSVLVPRA